MRREEVRELSNEVVQCLGVREMEKKQKGGENSEKGNRKN